jgi:hypothetical protein
MKNPLKKLNKKVKKFFKKLRKNSQKKDKKPAKKALDPMDVIKKNASFKKLTKDASDNPTVPSVEKIGTLTFPLKQAVISDTTPLYTPVEQTNVKDES